MLLNAVGIGDPREYPFPVTQAELGDALGLTVVHVNRVLRLLREDGLVRLENGMVSVLDRARPTLAHCFRLLEALDTDEPRIRERRESMLDALPVLNPGSPPCSVDQLDTLLGLARVQNLPRAASWPSSPCGGCTSTCPSRR